MMQLPMFDIKGQPTHFAMRYVQPKYYSVEWVDENGYMRKSITPDVHFAIKRWLNNPGSKINTHW